jgi:class 3 adenylate cyclase
LAIFLFLAAGCGQKIRTDILTNGKGDFSSYDFSGSGIISLRGMWEFYPNLLVDPLTLKFLSTKPEYVPVPSEWKNYPQFEDLKDSQGCGTYRAVVRLPPGVEWFGLSLNNIYTSYKLFINSDLMCQVGTPDTDPKKYRPGEMPKTVFFKAVNGEAEIILQVSNFSDPKGGILDVPNIDTWVDTDMSQKIALSLEFILFGSLLIMGLYYLAISIFRRNDPASFFFAAFCLIITFRTFLTGQRPFRILFPQVPYHMLVWLEFMTATLLCPIFSLFFKYLYPLRWHKLVQIPAIAVCLLGTLSLPFLPINAMIIVFYVCMAVSGIMCGSIVVGLVSGIIKKDEGISVFLFGFLILVAGSANDVVFFLTGTGFGYILPVCLFMFFLSQSFLLSIKLYNAFLKVEKYSKELTQINSSLNRFVPVEFLKLLGRDSITGVRQGDQVQKNMTILFCDIRSFTSLSEKMTPKENFNFLNNYLGRIAPIIRKHGGFIDKYIGDEIMALFPDRSEDALKAGIEIRETLSEYNKLRRQIGWDEIAVGIGIHHGEMILGTIGDSERLEGTVISDAVNLASRLEGLTKIYGGAIIISSSILIHLSDPEKYCFRFLGIVKLKGKEETVPVYEVINGDPDMGLKNETKYQFERGLQTYLGGNGKDAAVVFKGILGKNPRDKAALLYYRRSLELETKTDIGDWSGVENVDK